MSDYDLMVCVVVVIEPQKVLQPMNGVIFLVSSYDLMVCVVVVIESQKVLQSMNGVIFLVSGMCFICY